MKNISSKCYPARKVCIDIYECMISDMSGNMKLQDMKPSRLLCVLNLLEFNCNTWIDKSKFHCILMKMYEWIVCSQGKIFSVMSITGRTRNDARSNIFMQNNGNQ